MKTLCAFFWLFAVSIFFPITAQNEINLEELLERHSQTYMGSINDVFTNDELQVLQEHFNEVNNINQTSSVLSNRKGATTRGNIPVAVSVLDAETLELAGLGPSTIADFEGAGFIRTNPTPGVVVVDNLRGVHVRNIGSATSTYQATIDISAIPDAALTGIEVLSSGEVYAMATNGMNDSMLYEIDPIDWSASPIGVNNGLVLPINLMRDVEDNLYTLDIDNDGIYGVDKNTGVCTYIGDAGFDANFGQGGCYDEVSEKILLTAYNATIGDSELREVNPMTGATTSLGTITPGNQDQFGYVGWYNSDILGFDSSNFESFSFSPNPVKNELSLNANEVIDFIEIYNILGQKVYQKSIQAKDKIINMTNFSKGQYLMKVHINEVYETFKLVKI